MTTKASEALNLGNDVQIIREILFGQQAKQFQERIVALEEAVSALRQENAHLRDDLYEERQARENEHRAGSDQLVQKIEEEARNRANMLKELETNLSSLIERTHAQLDEQNKHQLADQTAMLDELLNTFKDYRQKITAK